MRLATRLARVLMWISLVVFGGFQWIAIWGIHRNNVRAIQAGSPDTVYHVWPLITAMTILTLAVFWFALVKRHRLPGLLAAGGACAALFAMALDIWQTFDAQVVVSGGLDLWTLIWRHMSCLLIFAFMLAAYLLERADGSLGTETREEDAYIPIAEDDR